MIKVLFFGALRDAAGCSELTCAPPLDITTLEALRHWLAARDPVLGDAMHARGVRGVRNHSFCTFDEPISAADEIAFVSPLSGG
jgi:molybdopterin synthase sulfur carrier subunit